MHYNCLIIDDEVPLADSTAEYLNLFEVSAKAVYEEKSALHFFSEHTADIILLDINLEQSSGFELCKKLRGFTEIPILFISARESDDDILLALNVGGDDYIKKPYTLSVLLAKVRAVLKRCTKESEVVDNQERQYHCSRFHIDYQAERVFVEGVEIRQKAMEYKLLCYLVQHSGRVIPKEELFQQVWEDSFTGDGTLNVHIRHLREQIEADPANPAMIRTIWGKGYLFEEAKEVLST